jgi:AcrR family transcriptional regulator
LTSATLAPPRITPGRLERRKARTRAAILEAAARLFKSNGFEETSIVQIAESAKTGVGTVYGYFASKEQILGDVLRANSLHAVEAYQAAVTSETPAIERVCKALVSMVDYIRDNRSILQAAWLAAARDRQVDEQPSIWLQNSISSIIRDGVAAGQLRDVPVQTTARMLITTYTLAALGVGTWKGRENDPQTDRDLEAITRALLETLH